MKRLLDLTLSILLIIILAPLLLLTVIMLAFEDHRVIIYRQKRVGKNCKIFDIFKFRSMYVDKSHNNYQTADNDPRITKIGSFIRKTSIDELPQLFNVLRGEMSIVGPRPDVPIQRKFYNPAEWKLRHEVRPGITGLAQATLRSAATVEQRKNFDLQYVQNYNLILDIKIIIFTLFKLISIRTN